MLHMLLTLITAFHWYIGAWALDAKCRYNLFPVELQIIPLDSYSQKLYGKLHSRLWICLKRICKYLYSFYMCL